MNTRKGYKRNSVANIRPEKDLNERQKQFCREYIIDYNGTRAYMAVYKNVKKDSTAAVNATNLLKHTKVQVYLTKVKEKLEELAGLSKLKVLLEYKKIAFANIADILDSWITKADFETLKEKHPEILTAIQEVDTKYKIEYEVVDGERTAFNMEYCKIKFYDKIKALDAISKLMGYNLEKEDLNVIVNTGITFNNVSSDYSIDENGESELNSEIEE